MTPRLWVASELYYPEDTSTGYFLTAIAEGLAAQFTVGVISGRPAYSARRSPVAARETRHGTTIYRMPSTRFDKDRLLPRLVNALTFTVATLVFAVVHFRRGDVALVVTNPPTLPFVVVAAARLRGVRVALLVHDVYPEVLAATGLLRPGATAFRALAWGFTRLVRACDRVIVLGRDMRDLLVTKAGSAEKIVIIPNWGDVDEVVPGFRDDNALRREHGLDGKFVVQFSGNAGRTHDLDSILDAAAACAGRDDIRFLLIGYGGKFGGVAGEIARRGLHNVILLPRQPRAMLPTMLACSDLTVIAFIDGMLGLSVPSRMYNVMAAGVPIAAIADARSELALVIAEAGCGWLLPTGSPGALATLATTLAGHSEARRRGDAGRATAVRDYTRTAVIACFADVLLDLANGGPARPTSV